MMFAQSLGDGAELAMLEPWHAEEFFATLDRARPDLIAAIPAAHKVHSVDEARATLQQWADAHAADTRHLFGVWSDGEFVGVVQLFSFDAAMGTCEMGVWLAPWVQGRGLITKACWHVLDWAFRVRGMRRVQWCNNPENVRSGAAARRLGMTREGLLRSAFALDGKRWDNEVWSLIAEEWPTPAPTM
jgi:ribosomal-protein-serine acetyltransferase